LRNAKRQNEGHGITGVSLSKKNRNFAGIWWFDAMLRGKKRKTCRQGRYLLEHRDEVIAELTARLKDGTFRLGVYHER
jgi:hypothetical protein